MPKRSALITAIALGVSGLAAASALAAQVNVGVNIGVPAPPPPIILAAPPRVVVVPNSPVSYAPSVDFNLFVYGGRYYTFHDGAWFYASRHSGPWTFIATERVPRPVIGVPVTYDKIPPGHAKKMGNPPGAPQGFGKGCPPGLAQQGRC
jgi:hypothetical protein